MSLTTGSTAAPTMVAALSGARILVLNWRDVCHPKAGGAEQYMHQIARRWAGAGAQMTWFTSRPTSSARHEVIDGIQLVRFGGELSLYPQAAGRLMRTRGDFDAIVDCQNGIPFFSPAFAGSQVPVVQVVHHVHQDQFRTRFSAPVAAVGRALEGPVARRVYGPRAIAAVSPSTRNELRRRLKYRCPIWVVPNGTIEAPAATGPRDPDPTVVVVSRLVPHKHLELLLAQVALVCDQVPSLRVEIVGDGPERTRLQGLVSDLGLQAVVTLHGHLPDTQRDALLSRAWLTTSTSEGEGWGCSVIEAAAWGVPCVALRVPGIRDSVLDDHTGWLVERPRDFGAALVAAVQVMRDERSAAAVTDACQAWARCFSWDRAAELLAGVVVGQARARATAVTERRATRSDIATVARFRRPDGVSLRATLRCTDEIVVDGEQVAVLLTGCDEADARSVLRRIGVFDVWAQLADRHDLLAGPTTAPATAVQPVDQPA